MWEHIQQIGQTSVDKLNTGLFDPAPKTGMKFRGAASKRSRDLKVSEKTGATYVANNLPDGARFNKNGNYTVSKREQQRMKAENDAALRDADQRRRRQDEQIALMLEEQARLMAQFDKSNNIS